MTSPRVVPLALKLGDSFPHEALALQTRFRGTAVATSSAGGCLVGKLVALGFATVMPFVLAGALLTSQSVTDTHSSAPLDSRSIVPIVPHATGSSTISIDAADEEDEPL